jgi:AAA+ superfamily predicted ATPase
LILTTNQIALFDVAIQSRIHIAIKFEELDKNQSIKIFAQQLDQYNEKGLVADYARIKKYGETDLPKKGFDGRQLRNIVASAIGRAQARQDGRKRMELEDIEIIVSNMASFKQDLDHRTRTWHGKRI